MKHPTEEEFKDWRESAMGRWFFEGMRRAAKRTQDAFNAQAWGQALTGSIYGETLPVMRGQAAGLESVIEASHADLIEMYEEDE